MYSWIHDADPSEFLLSEKYVKKFKEDLKENPKFLQEIVKYHFEVNIISLHQVALTE
jgi:Zn-dependent M16 (insulinase) family peptidase